MSAKKTEKKSSSKKPAAKKQQKPSAPPKKQVKTKKTDAKKDKVESEEDAPTIDLDVRLKLIRARHSAMQENMEKFIAEHEVKAEDLEDDELEIEEEVIEKKEEDD